MNDGILDIVNNYKNSNGKVENIKFEYDNCNIPIIIEADRNRIHQVLAKSIGNSVIFIT